MNNKSIWETFNIKVKSSNIKNELTTDILIIGGGITGLSVAYFLKDSKEKIALIDKGNNTTEIKATNNNLIFFILTPPTEDYIKKKA